jgi:nucleoside-diphosphate-sugar epimerase
MVTRLAGLLQQGRYVMAGRGTGHIHLVYIDDLVRAMILAGTEPRVAGRVYIVAGPEPVRIAELVSLLCGLLPASLPRWRVPVPALMAAGSLIEIAYRAAAGLHLLQPTDTPLITRSKVYTVTLDRAFSTARVRDELGFEPMVGYQEGLSQTIVWCKSAGHLSASL